MSPPASTSPPYPQVPVLELGPAVACLIVNVIVPGLGTLIAGVMSQQPLIGRAIAQFLLTNASWQEKRVRAPPPMA